MQLLEKAWAKIYGSYQRIEAGSIGEALPALTGAPTVTFNHKADFMFNPDVLWKLIENADKRGFVMTTAIANDSDNNFDDGSKNISNEIGLLDAHAYSVIAVLDAEIGLISRERLVLVRNPWGFREWSGDWSDLSTKWH